MGDAGCEPEQVMHVFAWHVTSDFSLSNLSNKWRIDMRAVRLRVCKQRIWDGKHTCSGIHTICIDIFTAPAPIFF